MHGYDSRREIPRDHLAGRNRALENLVAAQAACRACGGTLFPDSLVRYANMPRVAQHLPDASTVAADAGLDLDVRQCADCGLVQLPSEPVAYYREVIRAAGFSPDMIAFRRRQFEAFAGKLSLGGRKVLEAGCGTGDYLAILQQCGLDAHGIEYSESAVRACVDRGLPVTRGFIDGPDVRVPGGPFDAFFILNFLEHLPNPQGTLKGIAANLTDAGVGMVEVPNFDMMIRQELFAEFMSDHLLYFTRETLGGTLNRSGFDVLEWTEERDAYIISATVRKRRPLDLSSFRHSQARLTKTLQDYIGRFPPKRVAIWGAGHQAFAVMSLMGAADRIRYVVDSAPFKQGKFTPATHLPIVAPSALTTDPVDAVIVMAASYSNEVASIIRQTHGETIEVAILREIELEIAGGRA